MILTTLTCSVIVAAPECCGCRLKSFKLYLPHTQTRYAPFFFSATSFRNKYFNNDITAEGQKPFSSGGEFSFCFFKVPTLSLLYASLFVAKLAPNISCNNILIKRQIPAFIL